MELDKEASTSPSFSNKEIQSIFVFFLFNFNISIFLF